MSSVWDDPDLKVNSEYVRFDQIGDTVTGRVLSIKAHRWDSGEVSPQILLDCDGEERTVTAGQVRLKAALAEKRPERGDVLTITLADIEKRSGGKTLKHFDVSVRHGAQPEPEPEAKPASVDDVPGLTADQRAALKALNL